MKSLPEQLTPYKRTPEFNENDVPAGLLRGHQTKEGVWGKIVVLEGELQYSINDPEEIIVLNSLRHGVVEPSVLHEVKPLGKVRFYVEFYR